jgi:hypothetical protein
MEIHIMFSREFVFLMVCGALLAGSNASQASNIYNVVQTQGDGPGVAKSTRGQLACPTEYWVCCPEALPALAKEGDPNVRTDAQVPDEPKQPSGPPEDERRYYDYSRMILGD